MKWKIAPIAVASVAIAGCQTMGPSPGGGQWGALPQGGDQSLTAATTANPCAESERQKESMGKSVVGALVGGLAGAAIGAILDRAAGNKNNQLAKVGAIAGLTAGAIKGYNNGVDIYRRQCEVYKAAQARNATIHIATVRRGNEPVGEILVSPSRGFFYARSDVLTPAGLEHFREQGRQYNSEVQLAGYEETVRETARRDKRLGELANFKADSSQKQELSQRWRNMRIILTGHVDDRSGANDAVALSERRARSVANVFRGEGVPAEILYFEGAGSSLPIADNNTDAGREKNNRVDVAVFYDERQLAPYQEARQTDHRLFSKATVAPAPALPVRTPTAPAPRPPSPGAAPAVSAATTAPVQSGIEFGGKPLAAGVVNVSQAIGPIQSGGVSILAIFGMGDAIANNWLSASSCVTDDPNKYRKASTKRLSDSAELGGRAPISTKDAYLYVVKRSYSGPAGDHYVELKNVSLSKNGELAEQPIFNVFKGFEKKTQAEKQKTANPDISQQPVAFSVRGEKGVLIRQFFENQNNNGLLCMDVVLPNDQRGGVDADRTALVYSADGVRKVANFPLKF